MRVGPKGVYLAAWEKEFPWLTKDPAGEDTGWCKICAKKVKNKKSTLTKHGMSADHIRRFRLKAAVQTKELEM